MCKVNANKNVHPKNTILLLSIASILSFSANIRVKTRRVLTPIEDTKYLKLILRQNQTVVNPAVLEIFFVIYSPGVSV